MRTKIPEKLLKIVEERDAQGQANLTRLTVLKKWFERARAADRLRALGGGAGDVAQGQGRGSGGRAFQGSAGAAGRLGQVPAGAGPGGRREFARPPAGIPE